MSQMHTLVINALRDISIKCITYIKYLFSDRALTRPSWPRLQAAAPSLQPCHKAAKREAITAKSPIRQCECII